jgi:hypothetical protein
VCSGACGFLLLSELCRSARPDTPYLLAAVAVAAAVTWSLRALPFRVLAPMRASAAVGYLSARMPLGVMVILLASLPAARRPGRHSVQAAATSIRLSSLA